jgi:hypothetical protein
MQLTIHNSQAGTRPFAIASLLDMIETDSIVQTGEDGDPWSNSPAYAGFLPSATPITSLEEFMASGWHHLAIVMDNNATGLGAFTSVFVDGEMVYRNSENARFIDFGLMDGLALGTNNDQSGAYAISRGDNYHGEFDEWSVWTRPLEPDELRENFDKVGWGALSEDPDLAIMFGKSRAKRARRRCPSAK